MARTAQPAAGPPCRSAAAPRAGGEPEAPSPASVATTPAAGRLWAELAAFALGLLAGVAILQIVVAIGLVPDPARDARVSAFGGPFVVGLAALGYGLASRWVDAGAPRPARAPPAPWRVARVALTHSLLAIGGSMLLALVLHSVGLEVREQGRVVEIVQGGWSGELVALIVSAVALGPIAEELLFRGLLFRRLTAASSSLVGYGLSALVFALIHFNPSGLAIYGFLGLVFADADRRGGSIVAPIAAHVANNGATVLWLLGSHGLLV